MATKTKSETEAARSAHERDLRKIRESNLERGLTRNDPAEVHVDVVAAAEGEDGNETVGSLHAFGGRVYLEVSGVFSLHDWAVFQQQAAKAFQAVS